MRYHCWFCGKSVTTPVPDDTLVRALLVCPECIDAKRIVFPEDEPKPSPKNWPPVVGGVK